MDSVLRIEPAHDPSAAHVVASGVSTLVSTRPLEEYIERASQPPAFTQTCDVIAGHVPENVSADSSPRVSSDSPTSESERFQIDAQLR